MKMIVIALSAVVSIASLKAANLPDALDTESMSNLVITVKAKAEACDPKADEGTCFAVTAKIRRFCDEVDAAEAIPVGTAKEVRNTLVKLRLSLHEVEEKIGDATDNKEMRLEQLSADHSPAGTAYGIDLTEARSMVIQQFNSDLIALGHVDKSVRALDARVRDKIKALE